MASGAPLAGVPIVNAFAVAFGVPIVESQLLLLERLLTSTLVMIPSIDYY